MNPGAISGLLLVFYGAISGSSAAVSPLNRGTLMQRFAWAQLSNRMHPRVEYNRVSQYAKGLSSSTDPFRKREPAQPLDPAAEADDVDDDFPNAKEDDTATDAKSRYSTAAIVIVTIAGSVLALYIAVLVYKLLQDLIQRYGKDYITVGDDGEEEEDLLPGRARSILSAVLDGAPQEDEENPPAEERRGKHQKKTSIFKLPKFGHNKK